MHFIMRVHPTNEVLERVRALYERARFLDAFAELTRTVTPEELAPGPASLLAARLVHHLGAPERARRLFLASYRRNPRDPGARIAIEWIRMDLRGPWAAAESLERRPLPQQGSDLESQRDVLELSALVSLFYRDFAVAEAILEQWSTIDEADPSLAMMRSRWLERKDRLPEALEVAQAALEMHPHHRRLLLQTSDLLSQAGQPERALALLQNALETMQASDVARMAYAIAASLGADREAMHAVRRLTELSPLAEEEIATALSRMRAEGHFRLGETDEALALARGSDQRSMKRLIARIEQSEGARAKRCLDVPFVRQHHLTCAPATLAALCAFFGRPPEHVEVANRICYDGTPAHAERAWAEEQGFTVREFTLTWESARALLDRGLPFIVATLVPGSGHAQAVMGYDARLSGLILRDPTIPLPIHVDAEAFLEEYRHSGPRAMVLIPSGEEQRIAGIELPDSALYDRLHALERALERHERDTAVAVCAALKDVAPTHRLTRAARRAIASYDDNVADVLAVAEDALATDPTDDLARLDAVAALAALGSRSARIQRMTDAAASCTTSPAFQLRLAAELFPDAREHGRMRQLLRSVLSRHPEAAEALSFLGRIAWSAGATDTAVSRFRLAACVDPTDDRRMRHYFWSARRVGRTEEALQVVRDRASRFAVRSAEPAVLLADVLDERGDPQEALRVLEEAEAVRPRDGAIPLAIARHHASYGRGEPARMALERARGKTDRASWLRSAAMASASIASSADEQLQLWTELATLAPLDTHAQLTVATLLRRTQGRDAATTHLREHLARFPHHVPSARIYVDWLREGDPDIREKAIRDFLDVEPADAWAHRELALALSSRHRRKKAQAAIEQAAAIDPHHPSLLMVRASVAEQMGNEDEAREAYRKALEIDADLPLAVSRSVFLATPGTPREDMIRELFVLLERAAIEKSTFEAFFAAATPHLSAARISEMLDGLRARRPELDAAWILSMRHSLATCGAADAVPVAEQALARFPFADFIHLEAAHIWAASGDGSRHLAALEAAVDLGPQNAQAVVRLTLALESLGKRDEVDTVLARAILRSRFDPAIAVHAARIRARRGDVDAAVKEVMQILERDPESEEAWEAIFELAATSESAASTVRDAVRRIAEEHPHHEQARITLATILAMGGHAEEACDILDTARKRPGASVHLRDHAARILALLGRREAARRACRRRKSEKSVPPALKAREGWLDIVSGEPKRGVEVLREVLRDDPSLLGAWRWLIDALFEMRAQHEALEASRKLAAIAPFEVGTHERLARTLFGVGERQAAKAALIRALDCDATDANTARELLQVGIEDGDPKALTLGLSALRARLPEEKLLAFEIRAAIALGHGEDAVARFRAACVDHRWEKGMVEWSYRILVASGFGSDANDAVEKAMSVGDGASEAVGGLWVRAHAWRYGITFFERLPNLAPTSPAGRRVAIAFCEHLVESPRETADYYLRQRESWLCRDDASWSAAFAPLVTHGYYLRALRWAKGWRARTRASLERLHDLALAFHALGLRRRGIAVSREAMARATNASDAALASHRAWLALEEALSARVDAANTLLAGLDKHVDDHAFHPAARHVANIARAFVDIHVVPYEQRRQALEHTRQSVTQFLAVPETRDFASDVARRVRFRLLLHGQVGALFDSVSFDHAWTRSLSIFAAIAVLNAARHAASDSVPFLAYVAIVLVGGYAAIVGVYWLFRTLLARL